MNARKRVADIGPERLRQLNRGQAEATTLTECLAVDFAVLMHTVLPEIGADAVADMRNAATKGITQRMSLAADLILQSQGIDALGRLLDHPSDTVRGWACFLIRAADGMSLGDRLAAIRPMADDSHFGVREWAWMAIRPYIAADLDEAIAQLAKWTCEPSERLRRFTSEATRPRGVWCAHITALRQTPEKALPILEALRADPAPYVQNSVGNWLNDASKDRADWVRSLCARWAIESTAPATSRINTRALRSMDHLNHLKKELTS